MDTSEVFRNLGQIWHNSPWTVILVFIGFVGVLVSVVDTWRYRHKPKPKSKPKRPH